MMGNGLRPDVWHEFKSRFGIKRIAEFYGSSEGNIAFVNMLNKDCTVGTTSIPLALVKYDVDKMRLFVTRAETSSKSPHMSRACCSEKSLK